MPFEPAGSEIQPARTMPMALCCTAVHPSKGPENGGQLKVVIPDIIVIASSKQRIPAKSA